MHDVLPSQDVFHQSLSIRRSPWITLPPCCPSSSFAKTCTQKPATWDTICRLWITLLASNFLHLTITAAKQTYLSSLLSSLAPGPLLVSSICLQQGGLGVKPFRAGSVDYYKCVPMFLHGLKANERDYGMTASNTRGLDLMTQRGPLEPYTPNH